MANYESRMRTSYFNVDDEDILVETINNLDLDVTIIKTNKGLMIYGSDFEYGRQEVFDTNGDYVEDEEINVFTLIQSHLKDGESVLINSIGYEKMRYLHGTSTIITNYDILRINAEDTVKRQAVELGILTREKITELKCTN
ncbi:hypothetical protein HXA34_19960 [Salipaludibacillus agaradhaerens]|uniref:hypothetical protein n=1 Tax=Salipaludibacillus agaradhaerens TaxID=76935 RepID=UPI002151A127|nr:hypothetical protein [Salipaludibacillus agaradhaerens]MCR6108566.1 hypothetical protein [Salipaludibacillus agaradhaerens]MCR6120595.1 hypothetical protein [Salipaludibacillus agaradhaerens]